MFIIGNGPIITRDRRNPFIPNGAVVVHDHRIHHIGSCDAIKEEYPEAEWIDVKGKIIMPGFVNAHHHIYSAFARGMNIPGMSGTDFPSILQNIWWKIDRHLDLSQSYHSAISTYIECIRNGVTTVVDHHASYRAVKGSLGEIARAAEELGIRTCLAYEISDRDGMELRNQSIDENYAFMNSLSMKDPTMLQGLIGMHASFTISDETMQMVTDRNKRGLGYHIHVAEGQEDEISCREAHGSSVVERLNQWGILNHNSILGHCIHISESDMELIRKEGSWIVHNPQSNMGNAVGAPNIFKMIEKGIPVALGTDGYTSDMLESLKVAMILQKHERKQPDRGFLEAINMLFENNAELASQLFGTEIGRLMVGAAADIIVMDYVPYTPFTENNYNGHILFGMSGAMTDTVIINGQIVMKNRELTFPGINEMLTKSKEAAERLWRELNE